MAPEVEPGQAQPEELTLDHMGGMEGTFHFESRFDKKPDADQSAAASPDAPPPSEPPQA